MKGKEPYVSIIPCKGDVILACCGDITNYGSSMEECLWSRYNLEGIISCRICKKRYKVKNITAELEEVK